MSIQRRNAKNVRCSHMENLRTFFDEKLTEGWKRATQFIFAPPAEASFFSVLISLTGKVPGVCYIDDVEIFEI